jgi:circadian clock protein KaiB
VSESSPEPTGDPAAKPEGSSPGGASERSRAAAPSVDVDDVARFERLAAEAKDATYVLCLYVAGTTDRSRRALRALKQICEEHLAGRYELDVVDVFQQPTLAEGDQIVAVPTLIKRLPEPLRRFIGDLSSTEKVLLGLDLKTKKPA